MSTDDSRPENRPLRGKPARNGLLALTLAGGILVLVAGLAASLLLETKANRSAERAESEGRRADREAYSADVQLAAVGLATGDRALAERGLERSAGPHAEWEHRFLATQLRADHSEISARVTRMAVHPTRPLAALFTERAVELWDLATGEKIRTMDEVEYLAVTSLAFSPDGQRLRGSRGEMQGWWIWEVETGKVLEDEEVHGTSIGPRHCTVFDPKGRFRAESTNWGVSVIRTSDGEHQENLGLSTMFGVDKRVRELFETTSDEQEYICAPCLHFDRRADRLLMGHSSGILVMQDLETGELAAVRAASSEITAIDTHPDLDLVLVTSVDHVVSLVDPTTLRVRRLWAGGDEAQRRDYVRAKKSYKRLFSLQYRPVARFSPEGDSVFFLGMPGVLRTIDRESGDLIMSLPCHRHAGIELEVLPDRDMLVTAGADGVRTYSLAQFRNSDEICRPGSRPEQLALSPDGERFSVLFAGSVLEEWPVTGGEQSTAKGDAGNLVYDFVYAPDGKSLFATCPNYEPGMGGVIRRIRYGTAEVVARGEPENARSLAVHTPSALIAVGGARGDIVIFRDEGKLVPVHRMKLGNPEGIIDDDTRAPLAFCEDGRRLVVAHANHVALYDVATGRQIARHDLPADDEILCLACPGDSTRVILGLRHRPLLLAVDVATGRHRRLPAVHSAGVGEGITTVSFLAGGTRFISGGTDGRLVLWDAQALEPVLTLPLHRDTLNDALYLPKTDTILTTGRDRHLRALFANRKARSEF